MITKRFLRNMGDFRAQDRKQREDFVLLWAAYVKTHSDLVWSRQQNVLINSVLKTTIQLPRKEYLKIKEEKCNL